MPRSPEDSDEVRKLRVSSPGVLLILAVITAGGIYLLDLFFFEPYVARQKSFALREQTTRAENAARWALRTEQDRLVSLCGALSRSEGLAARVDRMSSRDELARFFGRLTALNKVDAAWLCDSTGRVAQVAWWSDDLKLSEEAVQRALPAVAVPAGDPYAADGSADARAWLRRAATSGLMELAGEVVIFARAKVRKAGSLEPVGHLFLMRRLSGALLMEMGSAISADLVWVRAESLPRNVIADDSRQRATWPIEGDRLAVAWPAKDPVGRMLGYFRADFSMAQIHGQAEAARKTILVALSLSGGAILLVILGATVFLANPIVRLLGRVHRVESGDYVAEEFTRDLHAEPLALARRLESAFQAMSRKSQTDELTGLANRRHFCDVLERAYVEARRYEHALSVMVMDIDLFKAINDTGGHHAGDELIQVVAGTIRKCCRSADLPARFGGDEFAMLLPQTNAGAAAVVAERIRKAVANQTVVINASEIRMTLSIGIADLNSGKVECPEDLLALADRALYGAKQLGRNRFVQAHQVDKPMWAEEDGESDRVNVLRGKLAGLDTQFKALCVRALQEIVQALERRDPHMADHARKVQYYAVLIAREMRLSEQVSKRIELTALLHDIGMLALPDSVALCKGRLDEQQMDAVKRHPLIGARIIEGMEFLEQVIPCIRSHHEAYDGKGYPEGISGNAIPLAARVVAVADAFDAMTSPRSFRAAKSMQEALGELDAASGAQFDPIIVESMLSVARELGPKLMDVPLPQASQQDDADPEPQPQHLSAPTS